MEVVYIAGNLRGDTAWQIRQNVYRAEEAAIKLWQQGYAVICVHSCAEFLQGLLDTEAALNADFELVSRADILYVLKGWQDSEGTKREIKVAENLGKRIIYEEG